MLTRRTLLGAFGASLIPAPLTFAAETAAPPKRLAVVTTTWHYRSHAWHMAERFMAGYPVNGRWHQPPFKVVSAYVDQQPKGDLAAGRAAEFGFRIYPTIAEALQLGGNELAVDAVLIIGEHGNYPKSEYQQTKYPRYEFFKQVTDVYRRSGRTAPVFNDKHLSWNWDWAKEMVDISRELKFGFAAGSSLPVTWRMPAIDMPYDAKVEELLCVAMGGVDSYDFHALEVIQCMASDARAARPASWRCKRSAARRCGTPWRPAAGRRAVGIRSCLQLVLRGRKTLQQGESFSHRYPTPEQIRKWVKDPIAYRIEYADGVKATMLLMNGLVGDFTFAARLAGQAEPLSTLFYLPPNPNVTYSASLMAQAEATFLTGRAPCPIERTLLTAVLSRWVASRSRPISNASPRRTSRFGTKLRASRRSHGRRKCIVMPVGDELPYPCLGGHAFSPGNMPTRRGHGTRSHQTASLRATGLACARSSPPLS